MPSLQSKTSPLWWAVAVLVVVAEGSSHRLWADGATPPARRGGIGSPAFQPIVEIDTASRRLDLGRVSVPGEYKVADRMVIAVRANIPHMGVIAELSPLVCENHRSRWRRGKITISPKNVRVRTRQLGRYVSMNKPVNLTGPMKPGVSEVTATFQVTVDSLMPPGEYSGVLTLTCAPPP